MIAEVWDLEDQLDDWVAALLIRYVEYDYAARDRAVANATVAALREAGWLHAPQPSPQAVADATMKALRAAGWLRERPGRTVIVKTVERDAQGQIVRVVEREQ